MALAVIASVAPHFPFDSVRGGEVEREWEDGIERKDGMGDKGNVIVTEPPCERFPNPSDRAGD